MHPKIRSILLAGLLAAGVAQASPDKDFLAAREAYAKGRSDQFVKLSQRIPDDYPLAPYLQYWRLKRQNLSVDEMSAFVRKHPDSPLSERVRQDMARHYGKNEDWPAFRRIAGELSGSDNEITCFSLRARLAEGDATAATEGLALYLTPQDLPSSCASLFSHLSARGDLTPDIRLARLRLALEVNNLRLARELIADLPAGERPGEALLAQAQRSPEKLLASGAASPAMREIALYALAQLAKTDVGRAAARWETHLADYPEAIQQHGWGILALHATRTHQPEAVDWFLRARDQLSDTQRIWKARAMLRAGRWLDVFQSIVTMPPGLQEEAIWRYWKARALKAMNATVQANQIFARLSRELHYYGLLASEELPVRLEARSEEFRPGAEDVEAIRNQPGLARALLLRKLDLGVDAAAEWQWTLRNLNDRQILAAAELARQEGWFDRAIITAEKTREIHNFDLRYLTPYRDLAETQARRNGLDPAWVYGLMRQESRFVDYARSGAGAQGLMQIMPATAKWIARQLGLDGKAHARMSDPEANIRFGTYYLKHVQDSLSGSPVLATAGYNAGPGRARRWQSDTALEGAIYVETIPFTETREYVKKVMANAIHYSQRLGLPGSTLKDRLGTIPPVGVQPGGPREATGET